MAENTNKEYLKNLANNNPQNCSEDNDSSSNTETTNSNKEPENMEVHHHGHHDGKKNWKSYFWEFIMLFLAVFCGSVAEYQLEHKIERDREKQYVASIIEDMKNDAIKIKKSVTACTTQVAGFDSLLENIYHTPYTNISVRMMYYLQRKYASSRSPVAFTKRTIAQLKNSGGMRLIRNKAASDSITFYNEFCEIAETQETYFANIRMGKVNDFNIQLFDSKYILNFNKYTVGNILKTNEQISLLTNDEKLLKQYANCIYYSKGTLTIYIGMLIDLENRIPIMINSLEKEYHLE